jgi:hypothetical protein
MKPSLGIYGDSWVNLSMFEDYLSKEYCWTYNRILQSNYDITISDLTRIMDFYSSFNLFKNTNKNYDKVIFVATSSQRQSVEYDNYCYLITRPLISDSDVINEFSTQLKKYDLIELEKITNILKAISTQMLYVSRDEFNEAGQAKLMDEILKIRPDTILIPAFTNRFIQGMYLCQIHEMEIESMGMGFDMEEYNKMHDMRHAHMTKENNEIFANYIYNRLQGKDIKLSLDMFVRSSPEEKSKYFIPR